MLFFFFPANKSHQSSSSQRPILPRPKHPPATYPARCIELLLHEPGISSLDLSVSDAYNTPTPPSSVCKIGLARAAVSRRMGLVNLGHRMSHRSNNFQSRETSSFCRYRKSCCTLRGCNCNLSTRTRLYTLLTFLINREAYEAWPLRSHIVYPHRHYRANRDRRHFVATAAWATSRLPSSGRKCVVFTIQPAVKGDSSFLK
jgi:hypothetical protein